MNDRSNAPSRVPVRGAIALALTLGGMALLLSFRGPADAGPEVVLAAASRPSATEELLSTALPADPSTASADPTPTRRPFAGVTASADPLTASADGTTSPDQDPVTAETTTDQPAAPGATVRLVGDPVAIRWGEVQVAITLAGDDIIDVETIDLPLADRRSSSINQRAEPVLRQQAIAIDSADVDVVSGATYTSRAYAMSLQSALDQTG
jgi:uncharacterized protein with FMN-binding domain